MLGVVLLWLEVMLGVVLLWLERYVGRGTVVVRTLDSQSRETGFVTLLPF